MHTDQVLAHFSVVAKRPCCDKCLDSFGDSEGHANVCVTDFYEGRKADFERQIAELEETRKKLDAALYLYPPVKHNIVHQAQATEEKGARLSKSKLLVTDPFYSICTGRLWFAQVRAVLDEKEKQWKVNLKQREAAKLAAMNGELERLVWYRNEVDAQHCDSSEFLYDMNMYQFLKNQEIESTRVDAAVQKAKERKVAPTVTPTYEVGINVQHVIDALDLHLEYVDGTTGEVEEPERKERAQLIAELRSDGGAGMTVGSKIPAPEGSTSRPSAETPDAGFLPDFGSFTDSQLMTFVKKMPDKASESLSEASDAVGDKLGAIPDKMSDLFSVDEHKEYNEAMVKKRNEQPQDLRHHPGEFNGPMATMPGWTCCGQQNEAASGCEANVLPTDQELRAIEREIRHKQSEEDKEKGIFFGIF